MGSSSERSLVIVDAAFPDAQIEREAAARYGIAVERRLVSDRAAIPSAVGCAGGLLVQYLSVDAATIAACPSLRVIGRYGVGLDNVDTRAAEAAGIAVVNVPDYAVEEVATHALALMLASWRRLRTADLMVRDGHWDDWGTLAPIEPLSEATLGLVGAGRIGSELARLARPLVARVLAHDPWVEELPAEVEPVDLDVLLERSDVVSLHVPLNQDTLGLMSAPRLARMRPGSLLVNVSRGPLVDTGALLAGLDAGRPGLAALDVLPQEPPAPDDPLLSHRAVLLTNHVAWYSTQSIARLRRTLAERCAELLA